jgi:hypothetical protein
LHEVPDGFLDQLLGQALDISGHMFGAEGVGADFAHMSSSLKVFPVADRICGAAAS